MVRRLIRLAKPDSVTRFNIMWSKKDPSVFSQTECGLLLFSRGDSAPAGYLISRFLQSPLDRRSVVILLVRHYEDLHMS